MTAPTCPYCGNSAALVTGARIYPHRPDLASMKFWSCAPCDAYVGCHKGTEKPLGRLANAALRRAKVRAHAAFDPLWRGGSMSRAAAYAWLARALGVPPAECHVGLFSEELCARVVAVCVERSAARPTA